MADDSSAMQTGDVASTSAQHNQASKSYTIMEEATFQYTGSYFQHAVSNNTTNTTVSAHAVR